MPIGYIPNMQTINQQAGMLAVTMRDLCQKIEGFQASIVAMGSDDGSRASALAALGFSLTDAEHMVYLSNVMNTLAQIYYGNAGQTPPYNFDNAMSALWGNH